MLAALELFTTVGTRVRAFRTTRDAATAMNAAAVELVPGAEFAGMSLLLKGRMTTVGATAPLVDEVDQLQYELHSGPCVDAVESTDRPIVVDDLRHDERWPVFGPRAAERTGVASMLSYRLFLEGTDPSVLGGLNLYSRQAEAFDRDSTIHMITVLAAYASLAVWGAEAAERAENLQAAVDSNREIGAAQGILMERHRISREDAFGLLRVASQNSNRKLRDVAADTVETGRLPLPPMRPRRR